MQSKFNKKIDIVAYFFSFFKNIKTSGRTRFLVARNKFQYDLDVANALSRDLPFYIKNNEDFSKDFEPLSLSIKVREPD